MWMVIIATLAVAFASGLAMGSSLERGHWERAIKDQLNKLDALLARHARRVRARKARRLRARHTGRAPWVAVSNRGPTRQDEDRRKVANAA